MLDEKLQGYLDSLLPNRDGILSKMEVYATEHGVPIMEPSGIEAMLQILRIQEPEIILEVGTAIGYSALRMAYALPGVQIVTIERDEERLNLAKAYIQEAGKESQISVIQGDALETEAQASQWAPYDAVFIDAAKGQYKRFFEMYSAMLRPGGMIITDNVLFKGLVAAEEIESKRLRNLVKKIDGFNRWLVSHPKFDTVILPVGDGVAISKLR
jgi:predicted O-methyltransferase YrrM